MSLFVDSSTPASPAGAPAAVPTPVDPHGPLLTVSGLNVGFVPSGRGAGRSPKPVVKDVSLQLRKGRCLALVGESGSGKSVTARTLVGLPGTGAVVEAQELRFAGTELTGLGEREWRSLRGARIGFVLQDALVSLDPLRSVGSEIEEALASHGWGTARSRAARAVELLDAVGVPEPARRAKQRPGELSGGQRQRALIASAVALEPELLIADEPTTALDVTVQAQVLGLFGELKAKGTSLLLISHDLSVVAQLADDIAVMQGGVIVEQGPAERILGAPEHPYTRRLLAAVPGAHTRGRRLSDAPLPSTAAWSERRASDAANAGTGVVLEASGLRKDFRTPSGLVHRAVDGVSFRLGRGRTLGIVGESGSGKSTTARMVLGLTEPDAGEVRLAGQRFSGVPERSRRAARHALGVVQQDPLSSFDPRWNVRRILRDALPKGVSRVEATRRVDELLQLVALPASVADRFPLALSGGQRQRVSIARALAAEPEVIVLDEAVSALDVSVQAQVLDLLVFLRGELGLSYLFISHDLGVISHLCDDVLVMKDGRVVETGSVEDIFERPQHPYTIELIGAEASSHRTAIGSQDHLDTAENQDPTA